MENTSKKAKILKNISWSVIAETVFKLMGFLFFLVFTRHLGQAVLGYYTYIFSVLSVVNLFWDLGINSYFARKWVTEFANYKEDVKLINTTRLLVIAISLVILIPYIIFYQRTIWLEFSLATAIYILDLLKALPALLFQSQNRFDRVFFINAIDRGLGYGLAILAIFAGFNLKAVLVSLLISKIASVFYSNYLQSSFVFGILKIEKVKQLLKFSIPLFLVGLFGSVYFRIDSIMIQHYLGFDSLGVYSAAYRLIDTGTVVSSIITSSVFPVLLAVQEDLSGILPQLLQKNLKYLMVLAVFMVICGMVKYQEVSIFLFGQNFIASGVILKYLSPSLIFLFFNGLLLIQMIASKNEKYVLKTLIILSIINILMNIYAIPHFGLKGAAVTTFISEVLNSIFLFVKLPVRMTFGWVWGLMAASAASVWLLTSLPLHWISGVIISGAVYLVVLVLLKVIDLNDLPFKRKVI